MVDRRPGRSRGSVESRVRPDGGLRAVVADRRGLCGNPRAHPRRADPTCRSRARRPRTSPTRLQPTAAEINRGDTRARQRKGPGRADHLRPATRRLGTPQVGGQRSRKGPGRAGRLKTVTRRLVTRQVDGRRSRQRLARTGRLDQTPGAAGTTGGGAPDAGDELLTEKRLSDERSLEPVHGQATPSRASPPPASSPTACTHRRDAHQRLQPSDIERGARPAHTSSSSTTMTGRDPPRGAWA